MIQITNQALAEWPQCYLNGTWLLRNSSAMLINSAVVSCTGSTINTYQRKKKRTHEMAITHGLREMTPIVIHEVNPSQNITESHTKGVMNKNSSCHPQHSKNVVVGREIFFPWISLVTSTSDSDCWCLPILPYQINLSFISSHILENRAAFLLYLFLRLPELTINFELNF